MSGVDIAGLVERLRDERHCNDWYLRQEAADALDEALAALKASEEREAGLREKLCPAVDWKGKLDDLYSWSGSAFLAGEKVEDEAGHKLRLYGFLCGLIGYLMAGHDAASVLESGPADLADATNNPPSDPGTEQREAGV